MKDPRDITWGGKRVGVMDRDEMIAVIGHLDGQIADLARHIDGCVKVAAEALEGRDRLIEECALAAEAQDRAGYEWVHDSLWAKILQRAGANVRALKPRTINASRNE